MMLDSMTTYRDAGVDIDAGDEFVNRIKPLVRSTFRPEVLTDLGGFGGLFRLQTKKYEDPVLVSGTDGVGTKLKIAFLMDRSLHRGDGWMGALSDRERWCAGKAMRKRQTGTN